MPSRRPLTPPCGPLGWGRLRRPPNDLQARLWSDNTGHYFRRHIPLHVDSEEEEVIEGKVVSYEEVLEVDLVAAVVDFSALK